MYIRETYIRKDIYKKNINREECWIFNLDVITYTGTRPIYASFINIDTIARLM